MTTGRTRPDQRKELLHRAKARVTGNRPGEQTRKLQHKISRESTYRRPQLAGERLLTAKELAQFLALPERRVYYWAGQGVLPHVRIGRSLRFDAERVRQALGLD